MRRDRELLIALLALGIGCADPMADDESPPPQTRPTTAETTTTTTTVPTTKPDPVPCSEDPEAERGVNAYMCSPGFALPLADGKLLDLADYEGQVVLLEFVTMWCGTCRQQAPQLQAYAEGRADDLVHVITLIHEDVFGETPTLDDITAWTSQFSITHPVVSDVDGEAKASWARGPKMPTPMTYILDQYGVIQFFAGGAESIDRYDEVIEGLLTAE